MASEPFYTVGESGIDGREPVFWPVGTILPHIGAQPVEQVMLCPNQAHLPEIGDSIYSPLAIAPLRVMLRPERWAAQGWGEAHFWRGQCPICGRRYMQANGPLALRFVGELCLSMREILTERYPIIDWGVSMPLKDDPLFLGVYGRLDLKGGKGLQGQHIFTILDADEWANGENAIFRWVRQLAWREMWSRIDEIATAVAGRLGRLLLES